jgi:hydrogenase expression/formation protein HypC
VCLSVAGRITRVSGRGIESRATVAVGSLQREVSLAMVPEAAPGDWVVFHSGYALRIIGEEEAAAYLEALPPGDADSIDGPRGRALD